MNLTDEKRSEMISAALEARSRAYAPYSKYQVGAALLAESGAVITGVNVENAVYSETVCAERSAVFAAVSQGESKFELIVVATANGGTPCGACRQVLSEFGLDLQVIMVNDKGEVVLETSLKELLPYSFGPDDLAAS